MGDFQSLIPDVCMEKQERQCCDLFIREAVIYVLRILPVKGGGVPPLSAKEKILFFHTDFPLRGGYPPIPIRKKSTTKRLPP